MNYQPPLIPKYYQIYEDLLAMIRQGEFGEGDRFPSDTELVKSFNVSRGTIREAVKLLIQQGFLVREQGKGTFITYQKITQDSYKLIGFTEVMSQHGIKASAKIIEKKIIDPAPNIKQVMQLTDDEKVVRIIRLRYGDKEPLIIERSFFRYKLFRPIYDMDLEKNSIFELLYRHTTTRLGYAMQRIEAMAAGQSEHKLLNVDLGTPLLLMKRFIQAKDGTYFQYSEDVYRSDRITFTTRTLPYEDQHDSHGLPLDLMKNE
ncbi:MAG: GntR family transcriptional regulator [Bacteroidetes bacterium]|nr:GntR family transcriptional regulator [Bacteroidota bacterium]MCH8524303.1 GntR family transcriptional regulator [Balneolales bacterium]